MSLQDKVNVCYVQKTNKAQEIIGKKKYSSIRIVQCCAYTIKSKLCSSALCMTELVSHVMLLGSPLRQGAVAAQSSCSQGHVVHRGSQLSQLSLHHPGRQPPRRVHHTRRDQPSRETQRHEPSFLEASICL